MPAARSRTERWRDSLYQIYERHGGIEISVTSGSGQDQPDLVWRVRILGINEQEMIVERPCAAGQAITLEDNLNLTGVFSVGQNRWMFSTKTIPARQGPNPWGRIEGLRIRMPDTVQRCARRDFLRVSTASLNLPKVQCWPLLDPTTVVAAEVANRAVIRDLDTGQSQASDALAVLPEVGPSFASQLLNIGGGGVGLLINREESAGLDRSRLMWMRIDLRPIIPAPIAVTARVVHTHIDSAQNTYAGVAFDFEFNPAHREFVVSQILRYVNAAQQMQRRAA